MVYDDHQIEKFIAQIIRAFSVFKVKDGVARNGSFNERKVPVVFGSPSRVAAAIVSNNEKFRNIVAPIMSVALTGINTNPEHNLNRFHESSMPYQREGKMNAVRRTVGPSLELQIQLTISATSVTELLNLFEQIALVFIPSFTIQKSTDVFDQDYVTTINLESINSDISFPVGIDARLTQMTMDFSVPIRLSHNIQHSGVIEEIISEVKSSNGEYSEVDIIDGDEETSE